MQKSNRIEFNTCRAGNALLKTKFVGTPTTPARMVNPLKLLELIVWHHYGYFDQDILNEYRTLTLRINGDGSKVSMFRSFVTISFGILEFGLNVHATGKDLV